MRIRESFWSSLLGSEIKKIISLHLRLRAPANPAGCVCFAANPKRRTEMKKILTAAAAAAFLCLVVASQATTITFEDLSGDGILPSNYQGLTWTNWSYYDTPQSPYDPSSGVERIYNTDQVTSPIVQFGQAVTFTGAWLAGYSTDQYFEGYFNGAKIFESAHTANDQSEFGIFFNLNWAGVDEIRVVSGGIDGLHDHYILDDLTYQSNAVPEYGNSAVLLGIGFLGLIAIHRLSRKATPAKIP